MDVEEIKTAKDWLDFVPKEWELKITDANWKYKERITLREFLNTLKTLQHTYNADAFGKAIEMFAKLKGIDLIHHPPNMPSPEQP